MTPEGRQVILCVDDSPAMLEMLRLRLTGRGYRVLAAGHPDDALRLLAEEPIDAMIVDYQMPEMTGSILASLAKALHEDLVVLMLSGSVLNAKEDLGAVDRFLSKGDSLTALDAQLATLLGQGLPSDRRPGNGA